MGNDYKGVMELAENLQDLLPWNKISAETYLEDAMNALAKKAGFAEETVHVDFVDESKGMVKKSILVVCPRYFRGISLDEELSAFLEYSRIVRQGIKDIITDRQVTVIPLHPQMINQNGIPDFARRAPHPGLVIKFE